MKKQDVFSIQDQQARTVNQAKSLTGFMLNAGGLAKQSENDLYGCIGVLNDLTLSISANQERISQSFIELTIIADAVCGGND